MTSRALEHRHRTVAVVCANRLLDAAIAAGLDPVKLPPCEAREAEADGFETRISSEAQLELWESLMRTLRDPFFPTFVGARSQPRNYDVVGFAYMTRANLREALEQAVRYGSVWGDTASWYITPGEREVTVTVHLASPARLGTRCVSECVIAEITHSARLLTGADVRPIEVRFNHPAPRDRRAIDAFYKAPVRFDCPESQLVFESSVLATPLLKADPDLAAFFAHRADDLLERHSSEGGLAPRLRVLLEGELGRGLPTLETAAARLGVSARTLRRRLQEEGTTFQDTLDETRCELAKRHLGEDKLALGEVAFLLGFSEPSAFHRAFKRWTGQTPLSYRRLRAA